MRPSETGGAKWVVNIGGGGIGTAGVKKRMCRREKKHERAETICMKMSGGTHGRYATFLPSITGVGGIGGRKEDELG